MALGGVNKQVTCSALHLTVKVKVNVGNRFLFDGGKQKGCGNGVVLDPQPQGALGAAAPEGLAVVLRW